VTDLAARATRLGPAFDLLAGYREGGFFLERAGLGLSTIGEADRVTAEPGPGRILRLSRALIDILAPIQTDPTAPAPVAVASIPFDDREPAEASSRDGDDAPGRRRTWQVEVAPLTRPACGPARTMAGERSTTRSGDQLAGPGADEYGGGRRATERIRSLSSSRARANHARGGSTLDWRAGRLRAVDADCHAFAARSQAVTGSVPSATPSSCSAAAAKARQATRSRSSDVSATPGATDVPDRLFRSGKIARHAVVIQDVQHPRCLLRGPFTQATGLLGTANVWHLATPFGGACTTRRSALSSSPCPPARRVWSPRERPGKLEISNRSTGAYAGPVGWVDANGDGEWAIALRCAEITGSTARLYAGAGIVADSEPEAELDELERKFRALLDALRGG
jgi:menaquinone-specific isochorismate synthase